MLYILAGTLKATLGSVRPENKDHLLEKDNLTIREL